MAAGDFVRPIQYVQDQEYFSKDEVGLNQPNTPAFIRLRDNGDIEIMATAGLGIVLRAANNSIMIYADTIKFMTKDQDGLRWNDTSFNSQATSFNEPTLIQSLDDDLHNTYDGVAHYLFNDGTTDSTATDTSIFPDVNVTDPASGEQITWKQYYIKYRKNPPMGGVIFEDS